MVESNYQRSTILPSEKAKAYKMRLDAMKRQQGERTDLTSAPVGQKSEGKSTREKIAENSPDSHSQIQRYIRLNELSPGLVNMVDEGKIAMRPAVELSYLSEQEQSDLLEAISYQDATPSLAQAIKMRQFSKEGKLSEEVIESIMCEEKPNQREKISFRADRLRQFIPSDIPPKNMYSARWSSIRGTGRSRRSRTAAEEDNRSLQGRSLPIRGTTLALFPPETPL